ncbi:hypothetical protein CHARACLAT_018513 [Characodon lateralis]|uniref:Uncharacterized protein n=1 Tax=Characodon lateralis TaxID=208331 RepID=A0ABU7ELY3_9TELE|nr:hypothetical protein [Characodon lateralis]
MMFNTRFYFIVSRERGAELEPEDNCKEVEFDPPGGGETTMELHTEMNRAGTDAKRCQAGGCLVMECPG